MTAALPSATTIMEQRRRFVFHAHAAAFGGQIARPKPIVLESTGGSALTVSGGRSVGRLAGVAFDEFFRLGPASTFAEGLFENDRNQFLTHSENPVDERVLAAVTHAYVQVEALVIGRKPRLTVGHLRADLRARSPLGSNQPSIRIDDSTTIQSVDIDGYGLRVDVDLRPFQRFDTHAKLLVAADDPAFVKESGRSLFMTTAFDHYPAPPPTGQLFEYDDTIYATIAHVDWADPNRKFPGATIENNMVYVPNFGRFFFGELLITRSSRRLTMVRVALGSDAGGTASAADVQDNGMWSN